MFISYFCVSERISSYTCIKWMDLVLPVNKVSLLTKPLQTNHKVWSEGYKRYSTSSYTRLSAFHSVLHSQLKSLRQLTLINYEPWHAYICRLTVTELRSRNLIKRFHSTRVTFPKIIEPLKCFWPIYKFIKMSHFVARTSSWASGNCS